MNELKYNKVNTKVNFNKLVLDKKKILGSGMFGSVYEAYNGKNRNNKLVVKKTHKNIGLQFFSLIMNGEFQGSMFKKEVDALKYLSKQGIAPKIYYSDETKMIYIIEKLDYTLTDMLYNNKFNASHLKNLIEIFNKLKSTPFKHTDLHTSNIMYSVKNKQFYIIDWGIFKIQKSCLKNISKKKTTTKTKKNCYNFTNRNLKYIDNLFIYILTYINTTKNTNKKTQMKKYLLKFLELFNVNSIKELEEII